MTSPHRQTRTVPTAKVREWLAWFGERSTQFFRNTGAAQGTFANSSGTEMEVGAASAYGAARLDNTVYWLGHDGVVYRLAGHAPQRISTGPIEQAIARSDMSHAYAFTFDAPRRRTTLAHLIADADSKSDPRDRNYAHLEEWATHVEKLPRGSDEWRRWVDEQYVRGYAVHNHVWVARDVLSLLAYLGVAVAGAWRAAVPLHEPGPSGSCGATGRVRISAMFAQSSSFR